MTKSTGQGYYHKRIVRGMSETLNIDTEIQYGTTISYIEHERIVWKIAKSRADRSDRGDAYLVGLQRESMFRMNHLLDELVMLDPRILETDYGE